MLLESDLARELSGLEVVRTGDLTALTEANPLFAERLAHLLQAERVLRHPLLVACLGRHLVVLDGNARLAAARHSGLPHLLVQRLSGRQLPSTLQLHALAVMTVGREEIVRLIRDAFALTDQGHAESLQIRFRAGETWAIPPSGDRPTRLWEVYRRATAALRAVADVEPLPAATARRDTRHWPENATALVVPPRLPVTLIPELIAAGVPLPWGALQPSSPRRILGLNLSLDVLYAPEPTDVKTAFVRELVRLRLNQRRIRYYEAPVFIFDD